MQRWTTRLAIAMMAGLCLFAPIWSASFASAEQSASVSTKRHAAKAAKYHHRNQVIRGPVVRNPASPSMIYYDYPYYYARGFYPLHIRSCLSYPCRIYSRSYHQNHRWGLSTSLRKRAVED
jgi:hypothetical protein